VSAELAHQYETSLLHIDIEFVKDTAVDTDAVKDWREEFADYEFLQAGDTFHCVREAEKMSKGKFNVVNPDDVVEKYGADTLRMYEMFLGPLEQHKPWSTEGISGVYNFLRKFWRLYHPGGNFAVTDAAPSPEMLKALHKTIKKINEDIVSFSFNTSVSAFMICVNQLHELKCNHREILSPLIVLLSPFAPHIAEELWEKLGNQNGISHEPFPEFDEKLLVENSFDYPVSFNGKMRFKLSLPLGLANGEIEAAVLADERAQKQLEGKTIRKVIVVPGKIVNIVVG
jgi:leucyl-tRNA synthetase